MSSEPNEEYETLARELLMCPSDRWVLLDWPPEHDERARRFWRNRLRMAMGYRFGTTSVQTMETADGRLAIRIRSGPMAQAQAALLLHLRAEAHKTAFPRRWPIGDPDKRTRIESARKKFFEELAVKVTRMAPGEILPVSFPGAIDTVVERQKRACNVRAALRANGVGAGYTISGTASGVSIRHRPPNKKWGRTPLTEAERQPARDRARARIEDRSEKTTARRLKSFERNMHKIRRTP